MNLRTTGVVTWAVLALPLHSQTVREDLWAVSGYVSTLVASGNTLYAGGSFQFVGPSAGGASVLDTTGGTASTTFPKTDGTVYVIAPDASGGW